MSNEVLPMPLKATPPPPTGFRFSNKRKGPDQGLSSFLNQHPLQADSSSPRGNPVLALFPSLLPPAGAQHGLRGPRPASSRGTLGNGSVPCAPSSVSHWGSLARSSDSADARPLGTGSDRAGFGLVCFQGSAQVIPMHGQVWELLT